MAVFSLSCLLPADPETAFRFHQDVRNLPRVQPGWAPVREVSASGPMGIGTRIHVTTGGFPRQRWIVEIEDIRLPDRSDTPAWIIDHAVQSPFPLWRHTHHFEPHGQHTRMTDQIEFTPPFGTLGFLLLPGIHLLFYCLFRHRHHLTRKQMAHE